MKFIHIADGAGGHVELEDEDVVEKTTTEETRCSGSLNGPGDNATAFRVETCHARAEDDRNL